MIQGPRTSSSPTATASLGSTVPASSTMRASTPHIGRPCVLRIAHCSSSGVPGGGQASVAIGEVSVMPHSCRICTPWRCSKVCIRDNGTADPPQATKRSDEMSWPGSPSRKFITSFQIVGTAPATVGRWVSIRFTRDLASMNRSGSTMSAPAISAAYGSPQALAWNIGTIGKALSEKLRPMPLPPQTAIECR